MPDNVAFSSTNSIPDTATYPIAPTVTYSGDPSGTTPTANGDASGTVDSSTLGEVKNVDESSCEEVPSDVAQVSVAVPISFGEDETEGEFSFTERCICSYYISIIIRSYIRL